MCLILCSSKAQKHSYPNLNIGSLYSAFKLMENLLWFLEIYLLWERFAENQLGTHFP